KHPIQSREYGVAVFLVSMNYALRIALRGKPMSLFLQLPLKLPEVIDLSIKHDPNGSGLIRKWLMTGTNINDAESTKAQCNVSVKVNSAIVGAAVTQSISHIPQDFVACSSRADNS